MREVFWELKYCTILLLKVVTFYFVLTNADALAKSFHYIISGVLNLVDLEHKIDVASCKIPVPYDF